MSKRVYLNVPFARKDEAKELGARFDPGVKLWWIAEGIATPFPTVNHDYEARRNQCRGSCFEQIELYKYSYGCGACELIHCPGCNRLEPQIVLDTHRGYCYPCDSRRFSGGKTRNEEEQARERGEARCCLYCSKKLIPIGTDRTNGNLGRTDWDDRLYHIECWKKIKRQEE
jgi:hypothetical protein